MKKSIVCTYDGHAFWVPKGANSLEMKLLVEKTMLWHQRLSHISEKCLRALKNKSLVEGLDDCNLEFNFCKVHGKQNCVSFYSSSHKSYGILDYIHLDVFGPVNVPLLRKFVCFVSFIDDYSRTFFYFLTSKSELFNRFKEFKALLENQTDRKIKCLRTENSGGFCLA